MGVIFRTLIEVTITTKTRVESLNYFGYLTSQPIKM